MKIYLITNFDYRNFERKFIDKQYIQLKLIGIDSGTFGTKGRVQLIIPDKSICFNDNHDAEVETISMCTSIIILIFYQKINLINEYIDIINQKILFPYLYLIIIFYPIKA